MGENEHIPEKQVIRKKICKMRLLTFTLWDVYTEQNVLFPLCKNKHNESVPVCLWNRKLRHIRLWTRWDY